MVLVGLAGLLVPVIVLVLTATRLGAARREQRLAAMRLAGATPAQISGIAAAEAVTAAAAGTVAGFAGFLALRPRAAAIPVDGSPFFPGDLRLSALTAVAIALGVPALSGLAAVAALRRVQVSPLGVARQAVRRRARLRRLIPLAVGLVGYGLAVARVAADARLEQLPGVPGRPGVRAGHRRPGDRRAGADQSGRHPDPAADPAHRPGCSRPGTWKATRPPASARSAAWCWPRSWPR